MFPFPLLFHEYVIFYFLEWWKRKFQFSSLQFVRAKQMTKTSGGHLSQKPVAEEKWCNGTWSQHQWKNGFKMGEFYLLFLVFHDVNCCPDRIYDWIREWIPAVDCWIRSPGASTASRSQRPTVSSSESIFPSSTLICRSNQVQLTIYTRKQML